VTEVIIIFAFTYNNLQYNIEYLCIAHRKERNVLSATTGLWQLCEGEGGSIWVLRSPYMHDTEVLTRLLDADTLQGATVPAAGVPLPSCGFLRQCCQMATTKCRRTFRQ
jgi:hypothetical protein